MLTGLPLTLFAASVDPMWVAIKTPSEEYWLMIVIPFFCFIR
jgi:hypothetical protein